MPKQLKERRRHIRNIGQGLVIVQGALRHQISDISVSGVAFAATGVKVGDDLSVILAHADDIEHGVACQIRIVTTAAGLVRGRFYPTMKLMRFIVRHFSDASGVAPRYFR